MLDGDAAAVVPLVKRNLHSFDGMFDIVAIRKRSHHIRDREIPSLIGLIPRGTIFFAFKNFEVAHLAP